MVVAVLFLVLLLVGPGWAKRVQLHPPSPATFWRPSLSPSGRAWWEASLIYFLVAVQPMEPVVQSDAIDFLLCIKRLQH